MKSILFSLFCIVCMLCSNTSRKSVLDSIEIFDEVTNEDTIEEMPSDEDYVDSDLITNDESTFSQDKKEAYDDTDADNNIVLPQLSHSKRFYQEMLEAFCREYYDKKYKGRHFISGSLRVDGFRILGDNIVDVWGTHTYKGPLRISTHEQRDFDANILQEEPHKYKITFTKKTNVHVIGISIITPNETISAPFTYN